MLSFTRNFEIELFGARNLVIFYFVSYRDNKFFQVRSFLKATRERLSCKIFLR